MEATFEAFPKIARLKRTIIVTEKIDGSNAQIIINDDATDLAAASRNQLIYPGKSTDNFGFAAWVQDNKPALLALGPGRHFGEWWGSGIQRGYGLPKGVRRFSLFNVSRWSDPEVRPQCCDVVPTLFTGIETGNVIDSLIADLITNGSRAAPFMNPEGIVVFHTASRTLFKVTCQDDEKPKGLAEAA
jgi:hypothetical protein